MIRDQDEYDTSGKLNEWILMRNPLRTATAFTKLEDIRKDWYKFVPPESLTTSHTNRPPLHNSLASVESKNNNIQKTPNNSSQ